MSQFEFNSRSTPPAALQLLSDAPPRPLSSHARLLGVCYMFLCRSKLSRASRVRNCKPFMLLGLASFSSLLLAGCGNDGRLPTAKVTGTVYYDGAPLPIGSVLFNPVAGGPSAEANLEADGTYVLETYANKDGAILGKHEIIVMAHTFPGGSGLPEDQINGNQATVSLIPERYGDFKKSGLTAEIVSGQNTVDLQLSKEPAAEASSEE